MCSVLFLFVFVNSLHCVCVGRVDFLFTHTHTLIKLIRLSCDNFTFVIVLFCDPSFNCFALFVSILFALQLFVLLLAILGLHSVFATMRCVRVMIFNVSFVCLCLCLFVYVSDFCIQMVMIG